jgi:ADP-dependent NAD(P)H-hydrate dehydratase / NAD(P)H-hydrate epimerase
MSFLIVGTVPYEGFPLLREECHFKGGSLNLGSETIPVLRGTPALLAAACLASDALGSESPVALLAGDIGRGGGSRRVYAHLVERLAGTRERTIVFHYLQPEVDWHNRILMAIEDLPERPLLVADAGYMYVAKMSGFAASYDLFTPDAGEMAFLADESAPHPFYTRGFLLQEENRVPELIQRAYENENAARYLLVKGQRDVVASADGLIAEISEPCVENMEPIGGTGDSLTGVVAALVHSGRSVPESARLGAIMNRVLGVLANPTPASSIADLLLSLPEAIQAVLSRE